MLAGVAAAAGLAVGAVTWYVARILVAREPARRLPPATPGHALERTGTEEA